MKTGIFCNYENYHQDTRRAIEEQVSLVKYAQALDFEEAWVTERHFSDFNLSPSILVLLAHLAGMTSTIRLGSAAVLLAFHNPIRVAEDLATLDNLSQGRLAIGIAKGGPFPEQYKHFATNMSESRAKALEAMVLVHKLLYETEVTFNGQYYQCDRVTVHPKPVQKPIPTYVASGDDRAINFAAEYSFGLMGGPPFALERLKQTIAKYRSINSSGAEKFVLARFFFVADTEEEAISQALPFIRSFSKKMQANAAVVQQNNQNQSKPFNRNNICYDEEYLLSNSIIGDVSGCRDRIKKLKDELNLETLLLKPCSASLQKNLESLQRYNQQVRTYV